MLCKLWKPIKKKTYFNFNITLILFLYFNEEKTTQMPILFRHVSTQMYVRVLLSVRSVMEQETHILFIVFWMSKHSWKPQFL